MKMLKSMEKKLKHPYSPSKIIAVLYFTHKTTVFFI